MRRILIVACLGVVWAGVAGIQALSESKIEVVKYPVPGSEDAVGQVSTEGERRVLDDFYKSKVLVAEHEASITNNADIFASLTDDRIVNNDERFGRGVVLTKSAWVANVRTGGHHTLQHTHDHVRLLAFGGNTVVITGYSTTVMHYGGKLARGPRLITEVWVKVDGRWQMVVHAASDLDEGMEDRAAR